jgi:hypothetical protein
MTTLASLTSQLAVALANPATRYQNLYSYDFASGSGGSAVMHGQSGGEELLDLPAPVAVGWSRNGTNYSFDGGYPVVGSVGSPTRDISETDCSGFVAWALQQVNPDAYDGYCATSARLRDENPTLKSLDEKHTQPWPSAADFAWASLAQSLPAPLIVVANQDTLAAPVLEPASVLPGDILAWDAPADSSGRDTGHVMVLQSSFVVQDGVYALQVCDSSIMQHINDPNRPKNGGVSVGTIAAKNTSTRFQFSFDGMSYFQPQHISVLRLLT